MISHLFCVAVTTAAVFLSKITAQELICTFTPSVNGMYANMTLNAAAVVNREAVSGVRPSFSVSADKITYMGMQVTKNGVAGPDIQITFSVEVTDTKSSPDNFNISLTFTNLDTTSISAATMEIKLAGFIEAFWDVGIPFGSVRVGRSYVGYNASNINSGNSVTIYFKAAPTGIGGVNLPEGNSQLYANIYFTSQGTVYGVIIPSVCLKRVTILDNNIVYEHGFTALTFFIMFFVGIALAILGVWLFLKIRERRRRLAVNPILQDVGRQQSKGKILLNNSPKNSHVGGHDIILSILSLKDKLQMYREIDNLDIWATIKVDTDLEAEQINAAVHASCLLIQGLKHNGDITNITEDKANTNLQNRLKALDKKLEVDYEKDLKNLNTDIEAKNKEKYDDLLIDHERKREKTIQMVKDLPETEKKEMLDLSDHQVQTEKNELIYKLALEQNEEAEKLRKEFVIRKRMGVTEAQQQFIDDVVKMGELDAEKAEWLRREHKKQQEEIHRLYDTEISRQRISLEEKLARRRALALASETQMDDHTEILNLMASVQLNMIEKTRKNKIASPELADKYLIQARTDLQGIKNEMDKEMELRQNEMSKRLGQVKKKCLDEKINEHSGALKEFISKSKTDQAAGPLNPISYVDGLVNLKSRHRQELSELENKIDEAQAKELEVIRDQIAENAKQKLKIVERNLVNRLKAEGIQNDVVDKVLKTHEKEISELTSKQLASRQQQEMRLKDELARRKRESGENKAKEVQEQKEVREYEAEIVQQLLCSQVAISDEERQRILKEFEKQMVKLENSLTLNKLKQKRLLEEKISERKARQLEELQQKQNAELTKLQKLAENNGEEDNEETHRKELILMKKHAEQQIALIQGLSFNIEHELTDIRVEMTRDRAFVLKEHEEKLGALITSFQMEKARQMVQIENQQKKIGSLKASVMDDLMDNGILSTPECERILTIYKEEHDELTKKLDTEKAKKEKAFRTKLEELMNQREQAMIKKQDNEMKSLMNMAANKTSAKVKHAMLIHKQMVDMEKFRNNVEREISQALEDTRRIWEIEKEKIFQAKEIQFLAGLLKVGHFERNELLDVLHMLFLGKTEEAVTELLNQIYQGNEHSPKKRQRNVQSPLADRVYMAHYSSPTPSHSPGSSKSLLSKSRTSPSQLIKKDSEMSLLSRDENTRNKHMFGLLDDTGMPKGQDNHARHQSKNKFGPQNENNALNSWKERPTKQRDINTGGRQRIKYPAVDDYSKSDNSESNEEDEHSLSNNRYHDESDEEDYSSRAMDLNHSPTSSNYPRRLSPLRDQNNPITRKKKNKFLKKRAQQDE